MTTTLTFPENDTSFRRRLGVDCFFLSFVTKTLLGTSLSVVVTFRASLRLSR